MSWLGWNLSNGGDAFLCVWDSENEDEFLGSLVDVIFDFQVSNECSLSLPTLFPGPSPTWHNHFSNLPFIPVSQFTEPPPVEKNSHNTACLRSSRSSIGMCVKMALRWLTRRMPVCVHDLCFFPFCSSPFPFLSLSDSIPSLFVSLRSLELPQFFVFYPHDLTESSYSIPRSTSPLGCGWTCKEGVEGAFIALMIFLSHFLRFLVVRSFGRSYFLFFKKTRFLHFIPILPVSPAEHAVPTFYVHTQYQGEGEEVRGNRTSHVKHTGRLCVMCYAMPSHATACGAW